MSIDELPPENSPLAEIREKPRKWTIPARKDALMERDPLVSAFDKKFKEWLKDKSNSNLKDEMDKLERQVTEKWQVKIHIPEITHQGLIDFPMFVNRVTHQAIEDGRQSRGFVFERIEEHSFNTIFYGFDRNGLICCPSHKIPVLIDPTLLTLNDIRYVKEKVWGMVEPEIRKLRDKKGYLVEPEKEPKELAKVFHCLSKTFDNYLRWYDQWDRGVYLRSITYIEMKVMDSKGREELFQKYSKAGKMPQTITTSMPADLARAIASKENAVRKGVNTIYFAIHRKKRPLRIPTTKLPQSIEPFNCPHHPMVGGEPTCPPECRYIKDYTERLLKS